MGAHWSTRLRPALGWLWISLATPALAQVLPPLPGEPDPPAEDRPDAAPGTTIPTGSVKGWAAALSREAEHLKAGGDVHSLHRFLDQTAKPSPIRLNCGLDFAKAAKPDLVASSAESPPPKTESPIPLPVAPESEPVTAPAPPVAEPEPAPAPIATEDRGELPPLVTEPATPATPPPLPEPEAKPTPPAAESDPAAALAVTQERLNTLPADTTKEATPATIALRALLGTRLDRIKDYENSVKARLGEEAVESSGPEKFAAEWKADLETVTARLAQAAREPDALLPASFRNNPAHALESDHAEMKRAMDEAQTALNAWTSGLEQSHANQTSNAALIAAARDQRDKIRSQLTTLKARTVEREAALAAATTPEARESARETLINDHWETRALTERLRSIEASLARSERHSDLFALSTRLDESRIQLARVLLDRMKKRSQELAAIEERDLRQAAAREETRAEHANDPLERYRASRDAELLELEARVVRCEDILTTNPTPNYDEQHALAERAQVDLDESKKLLDDGKISHLEALRLNTDFRRLAAERARIVRRDLAAATDRLTRAENALSAVETELAYDSRDDRFELDNLMERVPHAERAKAEKVFREFETKHLALLNRRRVALDRIAQRAERTHQEVLVRLRILDDHFGFIRTHMFWVRDEEPVGGATVAQAQRELKRLGRATVRIGSEIGDRSAWGRLSAEFLAASLGLVVLPWPLRKAHQALRSLSPPTDPEVPPGS